MEMIARRIQTSRAGLENPNKPIGVFLLVRPVRRRQDRDGAGAGRGAVRRRAEPHHHQHERVPGGAHRLHPQGLAARLRRLRRGRRADRGGAPPAVQRRAARRGGEGAPGRARDLLPGLRQGLDGRRRRTADRLQEHADPADLQRRLRPDHRACARTRTLQPEPDGLAQALRAPLAEGVSGGAARPADRHSLLSAQRRDDRADHPPATCSGSRGASARATTCRSPGTTRW